MRDHDAYGRTVAQCRGGGRDLGEAMVRSGWAVEYRQVSHGGYASVEAEACGRRRGLWAGSFEPPPSTRCTLKGDINGKGRRIVHAPGPGRALVLHLG
jgi:endonuclease YncB( thermonuclease family)